MVLKRKWICLAGSGMPQEKLDWCKIESSTPSTTSNPNTANTIGLTTFGLILPALLSGAYIYHGIVWILVNILL